MSKTLPTIGSSIICMDHINFERDLKLAEELGVDYLHLDVMDGQSVPRYGIYPEIVSRMASLTSMKMDLHLMVSDVELALTQFQHIENIEYITFHYQTNQSDCMYLADKIRDLGKKPGLVFNLSANASEIVEILSLEYFECVMFMGIHPGVLKQQSRPVNVIKKLDFLKAQMPPNLVPEFIQVDGGVTFDSLPKLLKSGANNFVCGSSTLYKGVDLSADWQLNSKLIAENFSKISTILESH